MDGESRPWSCSSPSSRMARFEVYEGGVLVVSPAPGVGHQRASYRLHRALAQAALTAGADAEVPER
jgi:hypothetical protein